MPIAKLKVLELFGGIGACSKALRKLGIDYELIDYVEINKYAVKSFNAINNTNFETQDICQWNKNVEVDLIMHGSPCQDFSLSGANLGGDEGSGTRSSLMYETIRIVEKLRPKYVIWENVKNLLSKKHIHNFEKYLIRLNDLGYTNSYQVLNSKDYGIPQNRERVFTISVLNGNKFKFPQKKELKLILKDLLEKNVDAKYYLSEKMIRYISAIGTGTFKNPNCRINLAIARPLTTDPNKRAGTTNYISEDLPDNYDLRNIFYIKEATKKGYAEAHDGDGVYINRPHQKRGVVQKGMIQTLKTGCDVGVVLKEDKIKIRRLTPLEYWRLMGFDDLDFGKAKEINSDTQLYKQAGNSIVVNVLEAILKNLLIDKQYERENKQLTLFDFL